MPNEIYSNEQAAKLATSKLETVISSDEAIKMLQLTGEEKVLILGAGNGYFTVPIAEATKDRVVAITPEEKLLELLAQELEKKKLDHVERMPGAIEFLNFPDRSFHRVLAPFTFSDLPDWKKTMNEMARVLNERGRLVIMDWIPKPFGEGPPKKESLPAKDVVDELESIGFYVEIKELNKQVYGVIADKLEGDEV